jgi:hypothetical protein
MSSPSISRGKSHCRLYVITARDAPVALIIRRGRWSHLVRWRMDVDTFEPGAWFHGRIYAEKCDLSPQGDLLVYFCHGGAYREGYTDSWTAVSRTPWLYALTLWPWGTTYGGGGRFVGDRTLILHSSGPCPAHPDHPEKGLTILQGDAPYEQSTSEVPGADWFGRDHAGAIIFCRDGKLFRRDDRGQDQELADFNNLRPAPHPAPDWAKVPLGMSPSDR